jgi:ribonuclease T2
MSRRRRLIAAVAGVVLVAACEPSSKAPAPPAAESHAPAAAANVPLGSGFDFYVLSLSWSPSYCEAEGEDANQQQCKAGRPYAFVVHGLWPQFEHGFPEDCPTDDPKVPNETVRSLYDLMPSAGLIRHEWTAHGACSGLSQSDYFGVLRSAREKIAIPEQFGHLDDYLTVAPGEVEAAFLKANDGMSANGIAVSCDKRFLREVRICLTKELAYRPCPEVDRRDCRLDKAVMPPVRGG